MSLANLGFSERVYSYFHIRLYNLSDHDITFYLKEYRPSWIEDWWGIGSDVNFKNKVIPSVTAKANSVIYFTVSTSRNGGGLSSAEMNLNFCDSAQDPYSLDDGEKACENAQHHFYLGMDSTWHNFARYVRIFKGVSIKGYGSKSEQDYYNERKYKSDQYFTIRIDH